MRCWVVKDFPRRVNNVTLLSAERTHLSLQPCQSSRNGMESHTLIQDSPRRQDQCAAIKSSPRPSSCVDVDIHGILNDELRKFTVDEAWNGSLDSLAFSMWFSSANICSPPDYQRTERSVDMSLQVTVVLESTASIPEVVVWLEACTTTASTWTSTILDTLEKSVCGTSTRL